MRGALRERDLELVAAAALHEHAAQRAILVGRLRIHHRAAATTEGAEFAGADGSELSGAHCFAAHFQHAAGGGGRHLQRQHG